MLLLPLSLSPFFHLKVGKIPPGDWHIVVRVVIVFDFTVFLFENFVNTKLCKGQFFNFTKKKKKKPPLLLCYYQDDFILDFSEDEDTAEEEQVPVLGLGAPGDLNLLVQQQLPVFPDEAEDEWALLHGHPAGSLLPGYRGRYGQGSGKVTWMDGWMDRDR